MWVCARRDPHAARTGTRTGLACLALGAVAVGTDGFMIAPLLPSIARAFGTSTGVAGQLVTVFAITYAVVAPVLASLFARGRRRRVLVGALIGLSAANALAALAPSLVVLFLARVTAALAAGQYTPTAALAATELAGAERRGRALGLVTAGLTVSIVAGVPLGALVGERFGWRATFAAIAVLSALVAIAARVALPGSLTGSSAAGVAARGAAVRARGVGRVLATTLLGILAGYLGYTYVVPISAGAGVSGAGALAFVLAGFGVGAACGAVLSGVGVDRFGQVRVVRAGAGAQAVALAGLAVLDGTGARAGVVAVVAAFAVLGAGSFVYNAPQQHRLIELSPQGATVLVSLNSSAIYAGIGASGALGALALQAGPVTNCLVGAAIALVTVAIAAPARLRWWRACAYEGVGR